MNYEELSDFEVNKAVAEALYPKLLDFDRGGNVLEDGKTIFVLNSGWMDYCNNPSDAEPIIVENRISILSNTVMGGGKYWQALDERRQFEASHTTNRLRAAMIVFLKMKESDNENN